LLRRHAKFHEHLAGDVGAAVHGRGLAADVEKAVAGERQGRLVVGAREAIREPHRDKGSDRDRLMSSEACISLFWHRRILPFTLVLIWLDRHLTHGRKSCHDGDRESEPRNAMSYQTIVVETHGRVGVIRLNRPQALNALNVTIKNEVLGAA